MLKRISDRLMRELDDVREQSSDPLLGTEETFIERYRSAMEHGDETQLLTYGSEDYLALRYRFENELRELVTARLRIFSCRAPIKRTETMLTYLVTAR